MGAKGFSFFLTPDSSQSGFLFFEIVVKGRSAKIKSGKRAGAWDRQGAIFLATTAPLSQVARVLFSLYSF